MEIAKSAEELIGKTPLLDLCRVQKKFGVEAKIFAKLESFNLTGSAKDRVALAMIKAAEKSGALREGGTIIEPTSGNTGIGLAAMGAALGYKVVIVMPENMSAERRRLIAAYGASVVLTAGEKGMKGAVEKAAEIAAAEPGSFLAGQFENPANPAAHYESTGPEIFSAFQGKIDYLVCTVGTGGTLTGCGKFLKEKIPSIKIVAVEPAASPLLSGGKSGPHGIQGIGANFIPQVLEKNLIDEIICVSDEDAFLAAKTLAKSEGVLAGISSGAALHAALQIALRREGEKNIVAIFPDTGERYLSEKKFLG